MSYQLTIEPLGQSIEVEEDQTILDACLRNGIWLPHACCHGLCATCKVEVVDGEIEHGAASPFALMDSERSEGLCLACCATMSSDVVISADIEEDPDAQNHPVRDYEAVVSRIEDLTPTIKGVFLALEPGGKLPFQAGQYVNLHVPGVDEARAFSLANAPQEALLELNIRLVPGGQATTLIHQSLRVGDKLKVSGPYGRFFVRKSNPSAAPFIAGGSGLSSPKSMILDLLHEGFELPITLVQGARSRDELYYYDFFSTLAAVHDNFNYLPVLSGDGDPEWSGARGFAHEAARAHFDGDFRGQRAYLCGPPPMIEAAIATLMQGRLFERDIFTEKFFSAADAQQIRSPLFRGL